MTTPDDREHGTPPDPADQAKEHLKQGLGFLWRAAQDVATTVRREIEREGVSKALDDAGREIARAASNVFDTLNREIGGTPGRHHEPESTRDAGGSEGWQAGAGKEEWPATRDEYERRYGPISGDWPRSPKDYEKRFGAPPPKGKPKGPTPSDPGFRIAIDDDEPK